MAAGNGFLTSSPDARYGDAQGSFQATEIWAQRFVVPGTGTKDVSELGLYTSGTLSLHLALCEDDAANSCPGAIVSNSDTGAIAVASGSMVKANAVYGGTKPQVTGGTAYWIVCTQNAANGYSRFNATGISIVYLSTQTYPTWPADAAWHSKSSLTPRDASLYAVYADATAGATAVPVFLNLQRQFHN